MRRVRSRWPAISLAIVSSLLAVACASEGSRCTALLGGIRYCLQSTADSPAFEAQQKVDIVFDGRQETMIAQLETDATGMRLVGTTPFGQKLVQLDFDNDGVIVGTSLMKGLDPTLLLGLVQIATWPAESVRAGLADSAVVDHGDGLRRLVKDGRDIVVITYTRGRPPLADMSIQLPSAGVEFSIVNLDVDDTE